MSGNENHIYIAIDLKSFYASVECRERDLDPLTTNLVVADAERTEKTICLAVSPSLKVYGIPGRARLFEVVQRVKEVNQERSQKLPKRMFEGSSCLAFSVASSCVFPWNFFIVIYAVTIPTDCNSIFDSTSLYETTIRSLK